MNTAPDESNNAVKIGRPENEARERELLVSFSLSFSLSLIAKRKVGI